MRTQNIVIALSFYKIFMNLLRIAAGIALFSFGLNISKIINLLMINEPTENHLFNHLLGYVSPASMNLTFILAIVLITLSIIEIIFSVGIIMKKHWAGVGLFVTSIFWIPIEILFISKFLIIHRTVTIILNILIIGFLFNLLYKHRGYFKK